MIERGRGIHLKGDPRGETYVFCAGKSVFVRNLANPEIMEQFDQHSYDTTVAAYAPSRYYIASADVTGTVKIWDTTQPDHRVKWEYRPLGGHIYDICWSEDSKKIVVAGAGRNQYAHVFSADTGSSVGTLSGQTKAAYSCDWRSARPYRIATCGEDQQIAWCEGPPFKFKHNMNDHTRFVNCVRFSPDAENLASAGMDGHVFLYDGKDGSKKTQFDKAHSGGIYSLSWNHSSSHVLTGSSDKTAQLFDAATGKSIQKWSFGSDTLNQVVSVLCVGDWMIACTLGGDVHYLDKNSGKPTRTLRGHNRPINALAVDSEAGKFYTGDTHNTIYGWKNEDGEARQFKNKGHTGSVTALEVVDGHLASTSRDGTLRFTQLKNREFAASALTLDSIPYDLTTNTGGLVIAASDGHVTVIRKGRKQSSLKISYKAQAVAVRADESTVAVGGDDNKIHIYKLSGDKLSEDSTLDTRAAITALAYSRDGVLASGDNTKKVQAWSKSGELLHDRWSYHSSRITDLAWHPKGKHVASASLDGNVIVWDMEDKGKGLEMKRLHVGGCFGVGWLDDKTIVTAGQDQSIKTISVRL